MDRPINVAVKGLESIHRALDSPYGREIHRRLKHRTPGNIAFNSILWVNLATFLAVVLAHFGLGLKAVAVYVTLAYGLIAISSVLQFIRYKRNPQSANVEWYNGVLEDAAIWSMLVVNAASEEAANPVIALCVVFTLMFMLAGASVKPYTEYAAGKTLFLVVSFCVAIFWGNQTSASVQVLFPLTVSFVLLFAVGYWHYIRQVRILHLTLSEGLLQRALEERNLELINEHRLRDRIIRHIGHDLRQPINSVALALFNLQSSPHQQQLAEQLAMARRSLESANCLIEDIVQISSYKKQGAIEVVNETCVLGDLVQAVAREYAFVAEQAGCDIRVVPSAITICSDSVIISRILRNFLSNAVRHAGGATILIGVRRRPDVVELQVWDNGPGMSREMVDNAFQEFARGESSQKTAGFGLGLNIAQTLAQAINASVAVESRLGLGTVCSLRIPRAVSA